MTAARHIPDEAAHGMWAKVERDGAEALAYRLERALST